MKKKIIIIFLLIASVAIGAGVVYAAGSFGLQDTATGAGYQVSNAPTVSQTVGQIVTIVLSVIGIVFFGLLLYGGLIWMTARGKEEKVADAKNIIESAIIGIIIVAASYAITNFVLSRMGTSGSEKGCCSYTNAEGMQFEEIDKTSCDTKNGAWQVGTCSP